MTTVEILLLAVALAMDAVAVSLARGMALRRPTWGQTFLLAGAFGLFQALMPVLGWLLSSAFAEALRTWAPWIAFGLLAAIGGKMVWEAFHDDVDDEDATTTGVPLLQVLTLAVATSIDAFAVGITFAVLDVDVAPAVAVIGVVTLALSLVAVRIGARVGERLGSRAELVGGAVLVLIGLRILLDHLGVL